MKTSLEVNMAKLLLPREQNTVSLFFNVWCLSNHDNTQKGGDAIHNRKKKSKVMEKTAKVLKLSKEFYKILNLTSIF